MTKHLGSYSVAGLLTSPFLADPSNAGPYIFMGAFNCFIVNRTTTSGVPLVVLGMASQSGDLQQWQDSTTAILNRLTAAGNLRPSDPPAQRVELGVTGLDPLGAIASTMARTEPSIANTAMLTTQVLYLTAIPLVLGQTVTSISFKSGTTAAGTPTNWWFSLHDFARNLLRQTADQTTTAWAANTVKTVNLTSTFTATYSGLHYLGIMVKATTVPTLLGTSPSVEAMNVTPVVSGTSTTGLTTTAPNPAAAITATATRPWAWVS